MTGNDIQSVKIFSARSHYGPENRGQLADILRPYWKDAPFSEEQRKEMYDVSSEEFCLAGKLEQADIAVLPMTWNFYLKRREIAKALAFIQVARRAGRPVLSYVSGDEGVAVPPGCEDVYVVRASGFRSRRRKRQVAQPVFFDDPAKAYPDLVLYDRTTERERRPSVGFCGQASTQMLKIAWDMLRGFVRNTTYIFGLRMEEPQPLYPPALLRARALRILGVSPLVYTQFIVRSRYRAGTVESVLRERTTREFYENVAHTDYTLCLRGGGNFSKRFYEAMAMGRIPLLVDTDCLLPFESLLPWESIIVRVPDVDLDGVPQRVADDFSATGGAGLVERKHYCRRLWKDWLSFCGFHRQITRLMFNEKAAELVKQIDGCEMGQRSPTVQREGFMTKVGCDAQGSTDGSQS
jgi:hypothetical protein